MTAPRTLGDKLQDIARRSPRDLHALDVLADLVLERLDAEQPETPAHRWKCDEPKPKGGTRRTGWSEEERQGKDGA